MERTQLTEILALVEMALGQRLETPMRQSLQRIQRDFLRRQARLVRNLDLGIVAPEEYLKQLNTLLRSKMDRTQVLLGDERFKSVFGEAGRNPESLVDRSTFMDAIAAERRLAR
jgi:hypothetical protein